MPYTGTLTEAQIADVAACRDEWMRQALRTDRCDRPAAEAAVAAAYVAAGLDAPEQWIWMDSPMGGLVAATLIGSRGQLSDQLRGQLRDQLRDQLWGQLRDQLRGQLWGQLGDQLGGQLWGQLRGQLWGQLSDQLRGQLRDQLSDQLGGQLRDQLWDQLRGQLGDQLWGQLWGQLRGQLWGQLRGQLSDQLRGQLRDQLGGQLWGQLGGQLWGQLWWCIDLWSGAYWMASYTSSRPIAGLPASTRLDTLNTAVQSTGWWWPMRGICVMTDRPTAIHRDLQGRLHHDTGPALTWADGYSLTSWHGITVPADFHLWDVETALAQPNAEVRRCGVERLGWDAITDRLALVAMADDPGNPGQRLALYDLGDLRDLYEEPARILICHNASLDKGGHRRSFGLPVPAHHADPVAAAADLFAVPADQYRALARAS